MKNAVKNLGLKNDNAKNQGAKVMQIAKAEPNARIENEVEKAQEETPKTEKGPMEQQVKDILQAIRPTAEQRIENAKNFEILTAKFEFLKKKAGELKKFNLQNATTQTKLVLKNQTGQDFEVSNTDVIMKALNVMSEELSKMLDATEKEVINFQV